MLITIRNKIFPFKGYKAMCVYPFLFVRTDAHGVYDYDYNHEFIHAFQQIEMHILFALLLAFLSLHGYFSLWYVFASPLGYFALYAIEYVFRLCTCGFNKDIAYRSVSFEREAYDNQKDYGYINRREHFASFKYIFK